MTPTDLQKPPTETEIADIARLPDPISGVIRRLAFQRDALLARVRELESERDVLNGTACAEETVAGNGPCGVCSTCWRARVRELEAGLTWTDAKPTVPGVHLWRQRGQTRPERWEIIVADAHESHGLVRKLSHEHGGYGWVWPFPDGQFAGPIPTPKEKPCTT